MELSVVVSTLNDRERLLPCLDALADGVPSATEIVVVNGPSSDGTTGAVRDRDDVDVLVEISDRSPSVSRNAGYEVVSGDTVAFLGDEYAIAPSWYGAVEAAVSAGTDVVTGPIRGDPDANVEPKSARQVAGRSITYFAGDNVAFDRTVLEILDGFDEYLPTASARDCAHRVAALGFDVTWSGEMLVRTEGRTDGGRTTPSCGAVYRAKSYRLAKNHGLRPSVIARTTGSVINGGIVSAREVVSGGSTPTGWLRDGVDVAANTLRGLNDGFSARNADDSARRNPNGVSTRHDRAVQVYDRR